MMKRPLAKLLVLGILATAGAALFASPASAFSESYGGGLLCGSTVGNCYIQSAGAHTFVQNRGFATESETYLACQLFNNSGVNVVTHGFASCVVNYGGGQFVWARVYNESSRTDFVEGFAHT